jgi:hypothetical protein
MSARKLPSRTWGIEEMGETLYVGPMRVGQNKLHSIAFTVEMDGYTDKAKADHRAECGMIVKAVNAYNRSKK